MGMGYGTNFSFVIEQEAIKLLVPEAFESFLETLQQYNVSLDDFAQSENYQSEIDDIDEKEMENIAQAWKTFQEAFQKKTSIHIGIGWHDSDNEGSRYDAVNGSFFILEYDAVVQFTPQAQALIDQKISFDLKTWVTYG